MKKPILLAIVAALVLSGCGSEAGPETIDLSDPVLYSREAYPSYMLKMEIESVGVDTTGTPQTFNLSYNIENQAEPKAQHVIMAGQGATGTVEIVIVGGQVMSVNPGGGDCSIFPASAMGGQSPEETIPKIETLLTGQAKRAKTGVKVEGITTDQYKITSANMTNPSSSATPRVTDGNVYVAREGGYVARVEIKGTVNTGQNGFDPTIESEISLNYTFVPVEDGSLEIAPPAECEQQLAGGGTFPLMDGATDLVSTTDVVYYNVEASLDEVSNFYRTRMVEDGWAITNDNSGESASAATMEFSQGDRIVVVDAIVQGGKVIVTLQGK